MIGEMISHYRVVDKIGAGGMGEVFRAHDPRLDREVAIKLLPESALQDPVRHGRFEREARSTGALNHPNIVAIYDVGQHEGAPYIVTELLEGSTLRHRMREGDVTVRRAVQIGIQIADGLAAAHAKGIVHRDLKPENVFVTRDGHVKILDFGLAKLHQRDSSSTTVSTAMTPTVETETGAIVGTLGYMSPEQLHGRPADQRSDIFAFGTLMYEMLAGRRAFAGDSKANVVAAILRDDPPPFAEFSRPVPVQLERLVRRCLDKRPEERFQSAHDLAITLRSIQDASDWTTTTLRLPRLRSWKPVWIALGTLAAAAAIVAIWLALPAREPDSVTASASPPPLPDTLRVAVMPFSDAGADPRAGAVARGISAWIADRLLAVEEVTNGEVWAVGPDAIGSRALDDIRKDLGVTVALNGEVAAGGSSDLRLSLLDVGTGLEIDADSVRVDGVNPCAAAGAAVRHSVLSFLKLSLDPETRARIGGAPAGTDEGCAAFLAGLGWLTGASDRARLEAAASHLEAAIAAGFEHGSAWTALATACTELFELSGEPRWFQRGMEAAQRATEIQGSDPEPWLAVADLHDAAGDGGLATESFEIAASLAPARADVHAQLGRRYRDAGRTEAAERAFQRAIRLRPGDASLHQDLGHLYWGLDRKDAAITEFREALDIAPENALAASNLCGVYIHFGLLSEADEMCEFSLELERNYMALSNLGSLAFRQSNFGEAVSWFEEALQLDESDYLLWGNLGFAYHHMDRDDEARGKLLRAVAMAERELAARPSDPWLPVDLGGYHAVLGSHDRALELLDAAAADPRDDPSWTLALGEAYEDAGEREEALRWVARALDDGLPPSQILNSPALRKVEAFRTLADGYEPGP